MMASGGSSKEGLISDAGVYFSKGARTVTVQADANDSLPSKFVRYWTAHKLYDVVIKCRRQKFEVHRDILSGLSDYFKNALSDKLENNTLTLDFDPVSMNTCLEYLYTGCVEVDRDRVGAVASLAKILDIPHLHSRCRATELRDAIATTDNCLDMWSIGAAIGDEEMLGRGKDAALANVDGLMEQESFMDLSYILLQELVTHENLVASTAGERLGTALLWVGHDSSTRSQHLTSLLTSLPMNEMSKLCLRQALHNPVIKDHPEACQAILRVIENRQTDTNVQPSIVSSKVMCLVSTGRVKSNAQPDNDSAVMVTPFPFTSKWYKLTDLPSPLPSHRWASVACYTVGSSLYVTGLGGNHRETWHFNLDTMHWERYGDMQHGRMSHCLVECGGTVYSLGGRVPGYGIKLVPHVEALDMTTKTWRVAGSLSGSISVNTACCLVDGEVLIHGILNHARSRLVQVYSPQTKLSRCLGSFKCGKHKGVCGVLSVEEKIIMSDGNGLYMCSASQYAMFNVSKRLLYELPCEGFSVLYPTEDGQSILAIGGWSRDGSANYVYRARVADVISNTGPGWQPVRMEWSLGKRHLLPGAHCTTAIDLNRLSQT